MSAGRFEDSLGSLKEQSLNNVKKQWVNLVPVKANAGRSSSPVKEAKETKAKALLVYYFGDKTKGAAAIQEVLSDNKGGKNSAH